MVAQTHGVQHGVAVHHGPTHLAPAPAAALASPHAHGAVARGGEKEVPVPGEVRAAGAEVPGDEGEEREAAQRGGLGSRGEGLLPLEHGAVVAVGEEAPWAAADGPEGAPEALRADEVGVEGGEGGEQAAAAQTVFRGDDLQRGIHGGGEEEERLN